MKRLKRRANNGNDLTIIKEYQGALKTLALSLNDENKFHRKAVEDVLNVIKRQEMKQIFKDRIDVGLDKISMTMALPPDVISEEMRAAVISAIKSPLMKIQGTLKLIEELEQSLHEAINTYDEYIQLDEIAAQQITILISELLDPTVAASLSKIDDLAKNKGV